MLLFSDSDIANIVIAATVDNN